MKCLKINELKQINGGGKSFAYRVGQFIRLSFISRGSTGNLMHAISEFAANEVL